MLKNSMLRLILGGAPLHHGRALLVASLLAFLFSSAYALAESGADIYKAKCAACHGAHGAGDTMLGKNLKLRPLDSPEVQQQSDAELATIISRGRNRMPAFDGKLTQQQIGDVVRYIRLLKK